MTKRGRKPSERLTKTRVDALLRAGTSGYYPDAQPGLSLRIRNAGKGAWYFSYSVNGKQKRLQLMPATQNDGDQIDTARNLAKMHTENAAKRKAEILAAKEAGRTPPPPYDPGAAKFLSDNRPADMSLREGLDLYAKERIGDMPSDLDMAQQERWQRNAQSREYLLRLIPPADWMNAPLAQLTALTHRMLRDRQEQLRADGVGSTSVNRATSYLITALNWMAKENVGLDANPFTGFEQPKAHRETSRNVVPTPDELRALWKATDSSELPKDYCRVWRLCLLTGARRSEIASMRQDHLFCDAATPVGVLSGHGFNVTGAKTEAGNRPVPLSDTAQKVVQDAVFDLEDHTGFLFGLSGRGVRPFSNWSRAMKQHRELAALPDDRAITIHDLRRLVFTRLAGAGVDLLVIQTLIGHRRGSATMLTYNRASYWAEMRAAVDVLESSVLADVT